MKVLEVAGVRAKSLGKAFRCPLHPEKHPSAALWRLPPDGRIFLHDFHARSERAWWPLPDVLASVKAGHMVELGRAERATWWLRGLADAGLLDLPAVDHPELPPDAPPSARELYAGFLLLLQVRKVYDPEQPMAAPYSQRFAQLWTGQTRDAVRWGSGYLLHHGYLTIAGATPRGYRLLGLGPGPSGQGANDVPDSDDPK